MTQRVYPDDKSPNPIDIMVGARVRAARITKGVSQTALADALGLTFQQVQKYERGANRISASKLVEIARSLEVPAPEFLADLSDAVEENNFAVFASPGVVELVLSFAKLSPRDQKVVLRLARDMAGDLQESALEGLDS